MRKSAFYLFFILLIFSNKSIAQHPVFYHLTEKDGLPDIEFYNMLEDNKGYIWLAADKGLFRYDGKVFKNYTHLKKRGLSVFGLKKDAEGRIWCNNISGQFFFIENGKLNLFTDIGKEINGELTYFTFFKNKLFINTFSGIIIFPTNKKTIKKTFKKGSIVKHLKQKDTLYNYIDNKIMLSTKNSKSTLKYNLTAYKDFGYNKWSINTYKNKDLIYAYNESNDNIKPKLFYESNNNLNEIKLPNRLLNTEVTNIHEINNELWFCAKTGLFIYTLNNNKLTFKKTYFEGIAIGDFLKDRNNNFWFTTLTKGIYIIPNLYIERYAIPESKSNINAMSKIGKDSLLIGSKDGDLIVLNIKKNKLKFLKKHNKDKVYSIGENKEKIFFSLDRSSIIYDKKKQQFYYDKFLKNAKDFIVLNNDSILNANHLGAKITNIKNKKSIFLKKTRAYTTHSSKQKEIYVGYVDGVEKYNKEKKRIKIEFKNSPIFAIDIDETNNGIIWISTLKNGIIGFKNDKPKYNYTTKNGLLSNQAGKIKGDNNLLWITTDKGIQALDTETNKFQNLSKKDGINSFNITEIIPFKNFLYFSSNKGLFKIQQQNVLKKRNVLDFYFTSILINDKKVKEKTTYNLKANQNKLKFNFQTNGFLAEDNIDYLYKLERGKNSENWNSVDQGINQITFNKLADGKYKLTLRASEKNNKQKYNQKTIAITIKPPYYKEWWFIILIIIIVLLITKFYIFKINKKQLQIIEKERMQKELIASKLETLQSQMNPHFTFNTLNSIQNLVLKGQKHEAYNYLTKFSSLLRENLLLSTKSFVYFDEELSMIKKYLELEKLRFKDQLTYEIIGSDNIDNVKIPTMIIQPFIENSIKHGLLHKVDGIGKIKIEFLQEQNLKCIITDNGVGIKTAKELNNKTSFNKKSFSTKSIRNKLKILKDYYKTDIGFNYIKIKTGTQVVIKIPYNFSDD